MKSVRTDISNVSLITLLILEHLKRWFSAVPLAFRITRHNNISHFLIKLQHLQMKTVVSQLDSTDYFDLYLIVEIFGALLSVSVACLTLSVIRIA